MTPRFDKRLKYPERTEGLRLHLRRVFKFSKSLERKAQDQEQKLPPDKNVRLVVRSVQTLNIRRATSGDDAADIALTPSS